jgi:methyltransferase (TIGR00027 family)
VLKHQFGSVIDMLTLRTLAIDEFLVAALSGAQSEGIDQLVILGAGLDARAFRLAELGSVDVLEVDHPATQGYKRTRCSGLTPRARSLRFVAVDFEEDCLKEKLISGGFDAARRTMWIWEGVIMYLSDAALRATLDSIAALSLPESLLLAQYREPFSTDDAIQQRMLDSLRRCGEPPIGLRTRETMRVELERAGLRVICDEGTDDWAMRFGGSPPLAIARPTRCLLGERVRVSETYRLVRA